jgi:hypothetical protein
MNIPKNINKSKNSSISVKKSQIPNKNQDNTSSNADSVIDKAKNISNEVPSKINTPIEFIRQGKKIVFHNSFDKNWTKHFLKQKEKALIEIKLDDKILEENKEDTLEMINKKNNNRKQLCSLYRKKTKDKIKSKNNIENDNNYGNKINKNGNIINKQTFDSEYKIDKKTKGHKIEKPKKHVLHKSSTCKIKIYDDNIKKKGSLFIFSEKKRN